MLRRCVARAAPLVFVFACTPGGGPGPGEGEGEGAAFVTITTADEELALEHDPLQSQLSLTPPAEGVVELTFAFQDPAVELRLVVDATVVAQGDVVALPDPAVVLTLELDGVRYDGTSGDVTLNTLDVSDDAATLDAALDVEVTADDDATATVVGDVTAAS